MLNILLIYTMLDTTDKNIFLQELEDQQLQESIDEGKKSAPTRNKKGINGTAIFAATFVFFLFIVVLLIFVLGLSGSESPIFKSFGIQAFEVKNFLKNLVNKTFMAFVIILLLSTAIGLFKGFSTPGEEKKKRRGSFIFATVAGGLIFVSALTWGGALAYIEKFVVDGGKTLAIEMIDIDPTEKIIAPIDIKFSAANIVSQLRKQGLQEESFRWSQNDSKTFTDSSFQEYTTLQFFTQGKQKIILEIMLESGEVLFYEQKFTIDGASFSVTPLSQHVGKKVTFSAKKLVPNGDVFKWDFDNDGEYDTTTRSAQVTHIFERPGSKTVHLRAEKKDASVEEFERTITILPEAGKTTVADIAFNKELEGKAPFEVTFDASNSYTQEGEIQQYTWRIGKKRILKKGISISHVFETAGKHTVELTTENTFGDSDTTEVEVVVKSANAVPVAVLDTIPKIDEKNKGMKGNIPFLVKFSAENSTDPDENITDYGWQISSVEGEVIETIQGNSSEFIFRNKGDYILTLQVTDSEGEKSTQTVLITTVEPPISPLIKASPQTGTVPLIVTFNGSESSCKTVGCTILSFEWDFKDGSPVVPAGAHISHQFKKTGVFDVEMTAITNTGEKAKTIQRITVTDPPFSACFTPSRSDGSAPLIVVFDADKCSKGDIKKYEWDFGDGFISSKKKPRHTYSKEGKFTATLTIFDENGRVSKATEDIIVASGEETIEDLWKHEQN